MPDPNLTLYATQPAPAEEPVAKQQVQLTQELSIAAGGVDVVVFDTTSQFTEMSDLIAVESGDPSLVVVLVTVDGEPFLAASLTETVDPGSIVCVLVKNRSESPVPATVTLTFETSEAAPPL